MAIGFKAGALMRASQRTARAADTAAVVAALLGASAFAQEADTLRATAQQIFASISGATADEIEDRKAVLGRALFWDERLSANGEVACASCHAADAWGADRRPFSPNARGQSTARHAQSVLNAQDAAAGLRWVADRASGAEQAIGSITGSMGFDAREGIVPVLIEHDYAPLFGAAFPHDESPVSVEHYGAALEAYQRTLRTPAALDRWLDGDDAALDERALEGLGLFISLGCAGCHDGPLLGGSRLQRFGIVADYFEHTGSAEPDDGLRRSTGRDEDRYLFRVQPLRNVARTAPYFHDGSVANLADAIRIMARVQLGQSLDDGDVDALVAFMEALTGPVPAHYAPPSD